jgi:hypothetical protein
MEVAQDPNWGCSAKEEEEKKVGGGVWYVINH